MEELQTPTVSDAALDRMSKAWRDGYIWKRSKAQEVLRDARQPPHKPTVYVISDLQPPPTQEEEKNLDGGRILIWVITYLLLPH